MEKAKTGKHIIDHITEREKEILQCVAAGLNNKEISVKLGVSINTDKFHLKNLMDKLEVHNSRALIRKARDLKLIS